MPSVAAEFVERGERLVVRGVGVIGAADVAQVAVLGADGGVIQPGGNRMRELNLPVLVGEQERLRALEHAEPSAEEPRRVFLARPDALAARLDADHPHVLVLEERMEQPDGVAAAADARDEQIRQTAFAFEHLAAGLVADDAVKIAHHHRVRMRAERAAENVKRRAHVA